VLIFHFHHPAAEHADARAVSRALTASSSFGARYRFDTYYAESGASPVDAAVEWVEQQLSVSSFAAGSLSLSTSGPSKLFARYHWELSLGPRYLLTITDEGDGGPSELTKTDVAGAYLQHIAESYGASIASVYTPDLLDLIIFGALCGADPDPFSSPLAPEIVHAVPRDVVERITAWTHPLHYDISQLPEGVGWINFWDADVVARLGRERVLAQPWASTRAADRDALLLVATPSAPSRDDLAGLKRIAAIHDGLQLNRLKAESRHC
jgi:hypothetical protein